MLEPYPTDWEWPGNHVYIQSVLQVTYHNHSGKNSPQEAFAKHGSSIVVKLLDILFTTNHFSSLPTPPPLLELTYVFLRGFH